MRDLLPGESERWLDLVEVFRRRFEQAGFAHVQTPILEDLGVFQRLGAGTDVVSKEMYTFEDRDGTVVALRPESTAGVARAVVQHHPVLPWKVWYFSQHFRHERPQKGRYRQHHQLGAECFGSGDPDVDVELIVTLWDFYRSLGLSRLRLELNSIGDPATRVRYREQLRSFLGDRVEELDPLDRAKLDENPMRVLDSKSPATRAALRGAPTLLGAMTPEAVERFERVKEGLRCAGIDVVVNEHLVRGLDYYTHTVFEIISEALDAANSTIGAGGRYDGLVEQLGGDPTPGFGFGTGVERLLLACDAESAFEAVPAAPEVFVVAFGGEGSDVRDLTLELRRAGWSVGRTYDQRSGRAQMKAADRSGASFAVLLGDDERAANRATVRDLRGDTPQSTVARGDLIDELRKRLT